MASFVRTCYQIADRVSQITTATVQFRGFLYQDVTFKDSPNPSIQCRESFHILLNLPTDFPFLFLLIRFGLQRWFFFWKVIEKQNIYFRRNESKLLFLKQPEEIF